MSADLVKEGKVSPIQNWLRNNSLAFVLWAFIGAFGSYFCMYAFRKPFNTGLYEGLFLWGISYKTVLILTQVAGYMVSKFMGIKVISELKPSSRIALIVSLIAVAQVALLLFGLVPYPYNFIFLFLNGLPLGMVYGVLFSFLEGRKFTETILMGLGISIVVASGILKTIYIDIHGWWPLISEFWMPFVMGCLFFPLFLFFVWMMSVLPPPSNEDIALRTMREPMTKSDKRATLKKFALPMLCYIVVYASLTTVRDFRDNFAIEIWNEIDSGWKSSVLSQTELISGLIVLAVIGSLSLIRNNKHGFIAINSILLLGIAIAGGATYLFRSEQISGYYWMLLLGTGTFLSYIVAQTALFERMIALYKIKGNAGFFVYLCDSTGYLGSVLLLVYREFFDSKLQWSDMLSNFVYLQASAAILLFLLCFLKLASIYKVKAEVNGLG